MEAPLHMPAGKLAIDRDRHVVSIHVTCESAPAALELYRELIGKARQDGAFSLAFSLRPTETIEA